MSGVLKDGFWRERERRERSALDQLRELLSPGAPGFRRFQVYMTDGTVWTIFGPDDITLSDDGLTFEGFVETCLVADIAAIEPAGGDMISKRGD